MPYQPVLATLAYVMSPDGSRVLMIHRDTRPDDHHFGKYNGLGGKLDRDESVADGIRRELLEEGGIVATDVVLRGTISWPGFGRHGEDWLGFIFRVDSFTGEPYASNPEGHLEWVPLERVLAGDLNLWEGDRHFLPLVFDPEPGTFHGIMPYRDGRPVSWSYSRIR